MVVRHCTRADGLGEYSDLGGRRGNVLSHPGSHLERNVPFRHHYTLIAAVSSTVKIKELGLRVGWKEIIGRQNMLIFSHTPLTSSLQWQLGLLLSSLLPAWS